LDSDASFGLVLCAAVENRDQRNSKALTDDRITAEQTGVPEVAKSGHDAVFVAAATGI
jgi:hypothetical protein